LHIFGLIGKSGYHWYYVATYREVSVEWDREDCRDTDLLCCLLSCSPQTVVAIFISTGMEEATNR